MTGLVLHAIVPVALHDPSLGPAQGNRYGVMVVSLPVGEPNATRRLQTIAVQTTRRKHQRRRPWGIGLLGSPLVQRLAVRLAGRQHFINIHVANIPGPAAPLYLAGARLTEAFPVTPLAGNVTLGVGVLSYTDQLNISVIADRDTCPDLPEMPHTLADGAPRYPGATGRLRAAPEGPAGPGNPRPNATASRDVWPPPVSRACGRLGDMG